MQQQDHWNKNTPKRKKNHLHSSRLVSITASGDGITRRLCVFIDTLCSPEAEDGRANELARLLCSRALSLSTRTSCCVSVRASSHLLALLSASWSELKKPGGALICQDTEVENTSVDDVHQALLSLHADWLICDNGFWKSSVFFLETPIGNIRRPPDETLRQRNQLCVFHSECKAPQSTFHACDIPHLSGPVGLCRSKHTSAVQRTALVAASNTNTPGVRC